MSDRSFRFAIMVIPGSLNGGGDVFLDKLIEYKLKPLLVVTHDPFYFPKKKLLDDVKFAKIRLRYLISRKDSFQAKYYTFFESKKHNILTFPAQIVNTEQCARLLKSLHLDYIFVFTFQILKDFIFTIPRFGTINCHPALSPRHRGSTPCFWTIKNRDKCTGITFHYIDKGIDTGQIITQYKIPLSGLEDSSILRRHLLSIGANEFANLIYKLKLGIPVETLLEKDIKDSYEKPVKKSDRYIHLDMESDDILYMIKASRQYGYALLSVDNSMFKIVDAIALSASPKDVKIDGRIVFDEANNIFYTAGDGKLIYLITKV